MKTNYMVSGLERSGTSLMMQILNASDIPIAYDNIRKPDEHNPRGYFELEGGKIIRKLEESSFDFNKYTDKYIKITSYGLHFLPKNRKFRIIYMNRNLYEIIESTKRMSKLKIPVDKVLLDSIKSLNSETIQILDKNKNIDYIIISYNQLIDNPDTELVRLKKFEPRINIEKSMKVISKDLYRCRHNKKDYNSVSKLSDKDIEIIKERLRKLGYL